MKLTRRLLALSLALLLLIVGCSNFSIPTNANTAFQNYTLCLFQQEVTSNTINLHYSLEEPEKYGITTLPITFGNFDFNDVSSLAAIENLQSALHKFSYRTLSDDNKLTYDILDYYFSMLKEDVSYHLYSEPLSPVTGIHAQLPVLLAEYQFRTEQDPQTYLELLKTLPDYFASLVRFEKQKSASGLFMSDAVADEVIAQCYAFLEMGEDNYLLSTFEERLNDIPEMTDVKRNELVRQNNEILDSYVLPSYNSLALELSHLKGSGQNPRGLCYYPDGRAYYTHLVAMETGSGRSISELKDLIETQILIDLLESQNVLNEHPDLLAETSSVSDSPDTILETLKQQISFAFPAASSVDVKIKYVPTALEEYLSPAFYLIPTIDNFSENTIYINPSYSLTDISLFTTLAHEGYPGHLYQTTYFSGTNPDPIRNLLDFSGYVEGWATYAEMCSYYLSPLGKPYATLLQANNSIILGLYSIADIGIHYDGWSLEETISHFASYGINDENTIRDIYSYILGDPANYLTYYVGYLEILELKKAVMKEQGDDFSQKVFHQKLLEIGPAPFEIIQKYMLK